MHSSYAELMAKPAPTVTSRRFTVASGLILALLLTLSSYAGLPSLGRSYFVLGVVSLVVSIGVFAYLTWLLLVRPLPQGKTAEVRPLPAAYRRILAALMAVSGVALVVGGFWDEVWHRQYGLPFGADLLWRPHQLIYSSLLIIIGLALGSALYLGRGRGPVAARFRADPLLGLLVLLGGLFLYILPADPLWHMIYGEDISAWSLPHLLLGLSYSLAMLLAVALQLSTVPLRAWEGVWRARLGDALVVGVLGFMLLFNLQVLVTEWDTDFSFILRNRPEWMLSAVLVTTAAFVGTLALQATRLIGAATAVGLLSFAVRSALLGTFDYDAMSANPWLCALPPLVALDLWHAFRIRQRRAAPLWFSSGLAAALGMVVVGFPLMNRLFSFPQIAAGNFGEMLLATVLASLPAAWLGQTAGETLAATNKQLARATRLPELAWVPPAALLGMLGFIVLLVVTATPPL